MPPIEQSREFGASPSKLYRYICLKNGSHAVECVDGQRAEESAFDRGNRGLRHARPGSYIRLTKMQLQSNGSKGRPEADSIHARKHERARLHAAYAPLPAPPSVPASR